ncbi:MAG: bifunctional oligoribonuclease/PAP phosphatase NrnA [Rickettsiales bacterium]|jgi:phosphoesterase RecJ-like protein|nr:bifunctional oligoribonuclease/PAP phosphatase NrnA [Rickettsiales bacterium]
MNEEKINLLAKKIADAKTILIFGHKNPDGDALSAALGLRFLIADSLDKKADVIYDGNLPFKYDFIPGRGDMMYAGKMPAKKYDLAISLDSPSIKQIGAAQLSFFNSARDTVKIDHHKTGENDDYANLNIHAGDFVATAEIIYEIAKSANWKISANAANCLYAGIYTDTGGFNYIDNGNALRVAASLVDLGADARAILPNINMCTRWDIAAQGQALANAEFFYGGALAIAEIPNKSYKKLDSGETALVMCLRNVKGVKVLAVLKEAKSSEIYVSLRSETVVVRSVAEKLGGGGHDFAAAVNLNMNLQSAKETIIEAFAGINC